MSHNYKAGDRVRVTYEGVVQSSSTHPYFQLDRSVAAGAIHLRHDNGKITYHTADHTHELVSEAIVPGAMYKDADGDKFIARPDGQWYDVTDGEIMRAGYPTKPLERVDTSK